MKNLFYKLAGASAIILLLSPYSSYCQMLVNTDATAEQMVTSIIGDGITTSNIVLTCDDLGIGIFTNGEETNIGLDNGVLLTSGNANQIPGVNDADGISYNSTGVGDADLNALISPFGTNNACVLEFDFVATGDQITVQYVFGSEEYNEYVCSEFNDVFAFFVSGPNPGGGDYVNTNVALIPGSSDPVTINNVNNGSPGVNGSLDNCGSLDHDDLFVDNYPNEFGGGNDMTTTIEYDGFTIVLFATVDITPGETYHFKFAVADASDASLDSGVFLKANSFSIFSCDAGEISIEGSATLCSTDDIADEVVVSNTSIIPNDTYVYLVTDNTGTILAIEPGNLISFEAYANGIYFIYGLSYDGFIFGLDTLNNISDLSTEGCFELSDPITIVLDACGGFDCPDQVANVGDPCNDDNPETINDEITEDCGCLGMSTGICYASQVIEYTPGGTSNGSPIEPIRLFPEQALGPPEQDNTYNFVSLGYGGVLILGFMEVALNGPGADLRVFETTFNNETCDSYEEVAEISVSQDGITYISLGTTCTNEAGEFDISDANPLWAYILYIKITDITPDGSVSLDAYDVDGVEAINGCDLFENVITDPDPCPATEFLSYTMGGTSTGGPIEPARLDPNEALGTPEDDDTYNFLSLGYGGELILGFNPAVINGPGADIQVFETTFGGADCDDYSELAEVFVSQDGILYLSVGTTCTNEDDVFDISTADPTWDLINFVKIVDITPEVSNSYDGFDVDGVLAINGCEPPEPSIITGGCTATEVVDYVEGTESDLGSIPAIRTNSENALGAPQDNDTYNFVSLGYGGSLTLAFSGAVLNGDGDDIQLVETSFGSPSCASNTEYADIAVSQDGLTYYHIGSICLDGAVDISDAAIELDHVYFVRIANNNLMSTTSDGYDVDAVIAIHNCEEEEEEEGNPGLVEVIADNFVTDADESEVNLHSYPNPTKGESVVSFKLSESTFASLEVYNMEGKNVATLFSQQAAANNEYRLDFNGSDLPNGIYVYRLTTENSSVIEKFIISR